MEGLLYFSVFCTVKELHCSIPRSELTIACSSFIAIPRPWCCSRSWWCLISNNETWFCIGRMAGCFSCGCNAEYTKRPPTVRIPCSSKKGFSLCNLSLVFTSFQCLRLCISLHRVDSWTILIMVSSVSFLDLWLRFFWDAWLPRHVTSVGRFSQYYGPGLLKALGHLLQSLNP